MERNLEKYLQHLSSGGAPVGMTVAMSGGGPGVHSMLVGQVK